MRSDEQDLIRERCLAPLIAVHEVGHALVAHALGYRVERVSRASNPEIGRFGAAGHVRVSDEDQLKLRHQHDDNALIAAGGAALSLIAGVENPHEGAESDMALVRHLGRRWVEQLGAARSLLQDGWEPVAQRLVLALETRPQLEAAEFAALMGEVAA